MSSKNEVITILGMCYQCKDVAGNALSSTHNYVDRTYGTLSMMGQPCCICVITTAQNTTTAVNCQHIDPYVIC